MKKKRKTPLWLAILQLVYIIIIIIYYNIILFERQATTIIIYYTRISNVSKSRGDSDIWYREKNNILLWFNNNIIYHDASLPGDVRRDPAADTITYPDGDKRPIRSVHVFSDNKIRPGVRRLRLFDRQHNVVVDSFL